VAVVGGKIAAVPGAAEQRRDLAVSLAEHMEQGGELLREQEEAAIGGRLLITQSMDDAVGRGAGGGDAARGPEIVDFGEEAGELAPACSFASLARFADQYDRSLFQGGTLLRGRTLLRRGGRRAARWPAPSGARPGRRAVPCGGVVWQRGWAGKGKRRWCWLRVS
jgi:hypothetical protein